MLKITPKRRGYHKIVDTKCRFISDYKTVNLVIFKKTKNLAGYFFFLRSSNLLVRSSKSTSSPPALFPPGTLSGRLGKSVGTAGRSGKLGPDEGRGALGGGG